MSLPANKIHNFLILLLAFSLPLDRRIPPILITLLFLNWLMSGNWKEKISNCKTHTLALLPCLLYLLYCIGMLYSENIEFGVKDLEIKLALLILPLIFASQPILKKEEIDKVLYYFTWGCAFAVIICFAHSTYLYFNEIRQVQEGILRGTFLNVNFFFSSHLSYFMHPSYFSMYLCLCISYLFANFFDLADSITMKSKFIILLLAIIFSAFIFFLASRMGIIVLILIWLGAILFITLKKKYYVIGIASFLLLIAAFILFYKNSQIIASRVDYTLDTLFTKNPDKSSSESSTVRMLIWNEAGKLVMEHPLIGVGTGDVKDVLVEKYKAEGMEGAFNHRLNAHNQFLQTGITLGIPGLLLMIMTATIPLLIRKLRFLISVLFCINIILNFSVESMLEVQAGVIFYSYFYSLFLIVDEKS